MEEVKDLSKLSDKELEKHWDVVAKETLRLRDYNKKVAAAVSERQAQRAAEEKVAAMSDPERQALAQAVQAVGIESKESVHNG